MVWTKIGGYPTHIDFGGPCYRIVVGKKVHYFEDHDYFGPVPTNKNGDPLARIPGERSPFWVAHRAWEQGGKRVTDDGECLFEWPKPKGRYVRLIDNQCLAVPDGATPAEIEAKVMRFLELMPEDVRKAVIEGRLWEQVEGE